MKPIGSFRDGKGRLYVDCAECKSGGSGAGNCEVGGGFKRVSKG
jgi:hypothetical protein